MRIRNYVLLASLTASLAAPAFAGEITGWRITKPAESPCSLKVNRVWQDGEAGAVHVELMNQTKYMTVGKLTAATKSGTNMVMDGSDFRFAGGKMGETVQLTVSKNPRGPLTGAGVMLAFTQCTVAMH